MCQLVMKVGLGVILLASGLNADTTLSIENCPSCFGGSYSLSWTELSDNGSEAEYQFVYGLDLSG